MITVLLPPGPRAAGEVVPLEATEVHHLRVRRAGEAIPVQVRDGEGLVGAGMVRSERELLYRFVDPDSVHLPPRTGDRKE